MPSQKQLDYTHLEKSVSNAQVVATLKNKAKNNTATFIAYCFVSVAFFVFYFGMVGIFFVSVNNSSFQENVAFIPVFVVSACITIAVAFWVRSSVIKQIKMEAFTQANGISLLTNVQDPPYTGIIYSHGDTRRINNAYIFPWLNNTEIGNYSYYTGSGKNRSVHTFGYIKLPLPRTLPHMLLDAKSNNFFGTFSNLPNMFSGDQKLSLEGDFNTYFTLYAPKEYETDALYVFTPDVMQALIESSKEYDVEIIDGTMYMYSNNYYDLSSESELQQLLHIISTLSKEVFEQTDYYADERVGDRTKNITAYEGRRLKSKRWPLTISSIFFISYMLFLVLNDGILEILEIIFIIIIVTILLSLYISIFKRKNK